MNSYKCFRTLGISSLQWVSTFTHTLYVKPHLTQYCFGHSMELQWIIQTYLKIKVFKTLSIFPAIAIGPHISGVTAASAWDKLNIKNKANELETILLPLFKFWPTLILVYSLRKCMHGLLNWVSYLVAINVYLTNT